MFSLPPEALYAKYLVKTHYLAKVIEFHPETQTVDIQTIVPEFTNSPIGDYYVVNEFGHTVSCVLCSPDVLLGVPVVQLRWGQFAIQACPVPGDVGYIEVFTNDIQSWIKEGEGALPWSDEHFLKKSCVFVPFVANKDTCVNDYPEDNTKLVIKSANASIILSDDGEASDVKIQANTMTVEAQDGVNITGDVTVDGTLHATTNVTAGDNNTALVGHTHDFNYIGAGQGSSPQTGTTQPTE